MSSVRSRVTLGALAFAFAGCAPESPLDPGAGPHPMFSRGSVTPDRHLVLFRKLAIPAGFGADVAALGGSVESSWGHAGLAVVSRLDAAGVDALKGRSDIAEVEPDAILELDPITHLQVELGGSVATATDPTLAFFYPRQWNMRAIQADQAWAAGKLGSPGVTVAILDSGIDYLYPDLVGRVDLSRSVSFVPSDDALVNMFFPGRHPVTDLHFHGTHVAAIVASNSDVIAGVTTMTTLIGVKVCGVDGECLVSALLNGFLYAVGAGADVINLSLGVAFLKRAGRGAHSIINRVMAIAQQAGTLVVVAAGNAAADLDHDRDTYDVFCSAPNVACVAATGPTAAPTDDGPFINPDAPAPYTNFGRSSITVAAPGGAGFGLVNRGFVWSACAGTSLLIPVCATGIFILGVNGTSQAAPHASGVAALLVERLGRNPQAVLSALQQTADDINQPGTDAFSGRGRINARIAAGVN